MSKSIEDNFTDWEGSTFGYGYGTGEPHTIPALRKFLSLCRNGHGNRQYDYTELERELTPTVAWLLINILCKHRVDILEYGTSPRFAWLTNEGIALRDFMLSKTEAELCELTSKDLTEYTPCYPDTCNCGPDGYQAGIHCDSPFWSKP